MYDRGNHRETRKTENNREGDNQLCLAGIKTAHSLTVSLEGYIGRQQAGGACGTLAQRMVTGGNAVQPLDFLKSSKFEDACCSYEPGHRQLRAHRFYAMLSGRNRCRQ